MNKSFIALAIGTLLCLTLIVTTANAVTVAKSIVKVTSVRLSKTKNVLVVNKTDILKATISPSNATNKAVVWNSSNVKVAKVDKLGKVTAVGAGTATITVTTVDGSKRVTCVVTVTKPSTKAVYNGSAIKEKVRTIEGVFDFNGQLALNRYGKQGASQYTYFCYNVLSGSKDINFTIMGSNADVDKKINTILRWILPTKGNTLISILDNPKVKSQTLNLDGRKITIQVENAFISINFGPTIK